MYDHMDHAPVNIVDFWHFGVYGFHYIQGVEFYLYPTVGTVLIHSVKPELTE